MGSPTRCVVELFISLIVALTGLIGCVWGIVKYYDVKRTKKEAEEQRIKNEQEQLKRAKENERDEKLELILNSVQSLQEYNLYQEEEIQSLQDQFLNMQLHLEETRETIDANEMDRLRSDIINCVNRIHNGYAVSQAELEHIHHCYDKYSSRGGNSYIQNCMTVVTQYENQGSIET